METCKKCEIIMLKSLWGISKIENISIWEATLYDLDIDNDICVKCLVCILKRFID